MLEKITLPIIVNGGLDTKSDSKLVESSSSLVQLNTDMDEIGAIKKREGTTKYTDNISPTGLLSTEVPLNLIEHNNELLTLTDSDKVYSYSSEEDKWLLKDGDSLSMFTFIEDKYGEKVNTFSASSAELVSKNFRVIGYVTNNEAADATTRAVIIVQDYDTKQKRIIWDYTQTIATIFDDIVTHLQVKIYDQTNPVIFIVYNRWNSTTAKYEVRVKSIYKDGTAINDVVVTTGSNDILYFDSEIINNKLLIATATKDLNKVQVSYIELTGVIGTNTLFTTGFNRPLTYNNLSLTESGVNIFIATVNDDVANPVSIFGLLKSNLSTIFTELVVTGLGYFPGKTTITSIENNTKIVLISSYILSADPYLAGFAYLNDYLDLNIVTIGTRAAVTKTYENASLVSKIYNDGTDIYFVAQSMIPLANRYLLLRVMPDYTLKNIGTFAVNRASNDKLNGFDASAGRLYQLPSIYLGKDSKLYYPGLSIVRTIPLYNSSTPNSYNYVSNVFLYKFDFDSEYNGINAKLGENTYIAGSTVGEYDGNKIYTQSFLDIPIFEVVEDPTSAVLFAGSYSYTAIFEFVDANGQVHRSQPATRITVANPGGKGFVINWTGSGDYLTMAKNYSIIFYRTTNAGTVYYRIGSATRDGFLYGLVTPYQDTSTDVLIRGNEQLYTNGGVLENMLLPPIKYLLTANNRIFALSSEDENEIFFSQPYLYGECVNFSQLLSLRVDMGLMNRSGKAMALGSLDGKIIVFKDQSIAYFFGDGPNQLGEQNSFSEPKLISSEIGLVDIKSIASIPPGLIFKSQKGIYLLDRSLQLSYIGSPVEAYNSEKIIGTSLVLKRHKVLFMTANRTLVFDYLINKWSTWDLTGISLITRNGLPSFIKSNRIYKQVENTYTDDSAYYSMKLITPWLKVSGIQDFQRVWSVMFIGSFYSAHTLTARFYYDYDDSTYEEHIILPLLADNIYQYQIQLTRQKCQSFKIEVYDNIASGTGQGFKLSNITLSIGQKTGLRKIADARKYV